MDSPNPVRWLRRSGAAVLLVFLLPAACSDPSEDAKEVAQSCGQQKCPVGTLFHEKKSFNGSYDVSGGYDPATYKAEGAYKTMGSGSCEYVCAVMQACPESPPTFPYITEKCFTCVAVLSDNTLGQPSCPN
jgi:hypothetical protein